MTHRIIGLGVLLCCLAGFSPRAPGQARDKKPPDTKPAKGEVDLNLLSMEVDALETIDTLDLNLEQVQFLEEIAGKTAGPVGQRNKAKASAAHRKALIEYHAALVKKTKDTEDQVNELQSKLNDVAENDSPELADTYGFTEGASQRAPELLRKLTVTQLAAFVGNQEFPDPRSVLAEAIKQSQDRDLSAEDWTAARDETVHTVTRLLAGADLKKYDQVEKAITALLDSARQVKKGELGKQRPKLEAQAKELLGNAGPVEMLRNGVEYNLGHFLSNPRLPQAVAARKKTVGN